MNQKAFRNLRVLSLSELTAGQEADFFALLTSKEALQTRDGKPFYKVGFRDAIREVSVPIWGDSPFADECREQWTPGESYKIRAVYKETSYGPQLEIRRIRAVTAADAADGFDPALLRPASRFDAAAMHAELVSIAATRIAHGGVRALVTEIYTQHRERLLALPAATRNHHAFAGGYLEHVLSVTKSCLFLADKYADYYPDLAPPLDKDLVIAGAMLHDIGKLRELEVTADGAQFTSAGELIGHVLQGRDILREAAAWPTIDAERRLRLEHLIVSHQRLPEWGSPKPPMTPEALLVHYADDLDAKFHMVYQVLRDDHPQAAVTSARNVLQQKFYRGPTGDAAASAEKGEEGK